MSKLRLTGSTSGYSEIQAPAVAGDQTFTLPSTGGTLALQGQSITLGTAQTPTSVTQVEFTGLPSTANRITVTFRDVSTNGTARLEIQVGTFSAYNATNAYNGAVTRLGSSGSTAVANLSSFYLIETNASTYSWDGVARLTRMSSLDWAFEATMANTSVATSNCVAAGSVSMASFGDIYKLRVRTSNTIDVFDAGTISIAYE